MSLSGFFTKKVYPNVTELKAEKTQKATTGVMRKEPSNTGQVVLGFAAKNWLRGPTGLFVAIN